MERKRKYNILNIYLINLNCTGITTNMSATSNNTVGHKCTACQLCQKLNSKMKHPNQMKIQPQFSEVYVWLKKHKPIINDSACLCLPYVKQIQRNHSKEFTPRWLPKHPVPPKPSCKLVNNNQEHGAVRQRVDTESKSMPTTEALYTSTLEKMLVSCGNVYSTVQL